MSSFQGCLELMESLVKALERYEGLSEDLLGIKGKISAQKLRDFVSERAGIMERIKVYIDTLQGYRRILDDPSGEKLQTLKQRVMRLQTRCGKRDAELTRRLIDRRGVVLTELKALTHAGHAMRGYGRRTPLPPRFLDSRS